MSGGDTDWIEYFDNKQPLYGDGRKSRRYVKEGKHGFSAVIREVPHIVRKDTRQPSWGLFLYKYGDSIAHDGLSNVPYICATMLEAISIAEKRLEALEGNVAIVYESGSIGVYER